MSVLWVMPMTQWEYALTPVSIYSPIGIQALNRFDREGWEPLCISPDGFAVLRRVRDPNAPEVDLPELPDLRPLAAVPPLAPPNVGPPVPPERVDPEAILVPHGMTNEEALAVVNAPVVDAEIVEPKPAPLPMPPTMAAARARFAAMTAKRNGTAPRPPVELEVDYVLEPGDDVATKLNISIWNPGIGKTFLVLDASNGRAPGVWKFTKPVETGTVQAGQASGGGGTFIQSVRIADPYVGQSVRVKKGSFEGTIWDATGPGGYVRRKG